MAHYTSLGNIPHKRHTQFRKPDGSLYSEQLFSTEGFSNDYSLLYHTHPPTQIIKTDEPVNVAPIIAEEKMLKHRSFEGFKIKPRQDYLQSRKPVLVNNDCHISLAAPQQSMSDYFYKNADADELIFIHEGSGKLLTQYGELTFWYGDYLVIPRGTIYQIVLIACDNRLFIVESFSPIRFPKRYLSKYGQLLEHSPYCERDIRTPQHLQTHDEKGDFIIRTKKRACYTACIMRTTRLMWWAGMAVVIPLPLAFTILNPLPAGYINRRRYTKLLKPTILWCALLYRVCLIIIHYLYLRLTTTAILTVMNCCIMWMAIL